MSDIELVVIDRGTQEAVVIERQSRADLVAVGAQGPSGADGAQGPTGDKGDKGDKGDPGVSLSDDIPADPLAYYILAKS